MSKFYDSLPGVKLVVLYGVERVHNELIQQAHHALSYMHAESPYAKQLQALYERWQAEEKELAAIEESIRNEQ